MVELGQVVVVPEADYCYGVGPLRLRVTAVDADLIMHPRLEWVLLEGTEIRHDGTDGAHRHVLVRTAALRKVA